MYIHKSVCISPQHTFSEIHIENIVPSVENKLTVIEPKYENIPLNTLRRMGKAVRIGVGTAIPLIKEYPELNGIIIGTANGGMEDCIKFLMQMMKYDEGTLTPTNFVQSTTNAIAAQIGLTGRNKEYNITHVHRGLAFENSLLDAMMLLNENPANTYLLGGIDEVSSYNFNILKLGGWYKKEAILNTDIYNNTTNGSIAGEGAAMFIVNNRNEGSVAKVKMLKTLTTDNKDEVEAELKNILANNKDQQIDLFLSGENGDQRQFHFYNACESILNDNISIGRFKHLCGEFPTATSFALWLACHILDRQQVPQHVFKRKSQNKSFQNILIYNNYQGLQHSFIWVMK